MIATVDSFEYLDNLVVYLKHGSKIAAKITFCLNLTENFENIQSKEKQRKLYQGNKLQGNTQFTLKNPFTCIIRL